MNLNHLSVQNLITLASEAFEAGDEAQAELVVTELRNRGENAASIEDKLDKRAGRVRFSARAKAFSGQGARDHKFLVEGDAVRVWDDVAKHYTLCHDLSAGAQKRLLAIAEEVRRGLR